MRPDGDESAAPVIDRDTIASVAVAATFTAEPLTERLASWLHELSPAATVALTPFNQVFQELLRPAGALNQAALRVVLFRLEDWHGRGPPRDKTDATAWAEVLDELVSAVRVAADYNPGPLLVVHCPPSPQYAADGAACDASIHVEQRLAAVRLERANV